MRIIGLDIHRAFAEAVAWDDGKLKRLGRVDMRRPLLEAFAKKLSKDDVVVVEATGNASSVAAVIAPHVKKVVIANPMQVRIIAHAKIKTDTIDASVLAQLYATGFLPEVWIPDEPTQALRRQVTRRNQIVRQRSRLKNIIQSILPERSRQVSAFADYSARRHGLLTLGVVIVSVVVFSAVFAPWIAPYSPYDLDVAVMLEGPSKTHWLGTDEVGRDVLSRTIFAAQISVKVALFAVGVGLTGGTIIGMLAAYCSGVVDMLLMRLMELLFSFPAILLAVVLMASLGTNVLNAMLAIGIIFIPGFARLARASTLSALQQQYVEAARSIGMSHSRIIMRELFPNVVTPLLVEAAVAFAYAVLLESALSFLGLGAQPPEPSWGNMLNTGRGFMAQAPWLSIVPGSALFLCVLGFNLLGDGLRDMLDPHLRD